MELIIRGYIGLGSNLGDRLANLQRAVDLMVGASRLTVTGVSSVYEAPPWGYESSNPYLNAVAAVTWEGPPLRLLEQCYRIEASMGRHSAGPRDYDGYRDRTIDLDILWLDNMESADSRLALPHPHAHERGFVLMPLNELEPGLVFRGRTVAEWLSGLDPTESAAVVPQENLHLSVTA